MSIWSGAGKVEISSCREKSGSRAAFARARSQGKNHFAALLAEPIRYIALDRRKIDGDSPLQGQLVA
jgi:hypothetical protein